MSPSLPANHMLSHTVTQHHLTITQLKLPGVYYHCSLHDHLNGWFIKCNNDHFITDGITTLNSSLLSSLRQGSTHWAHCSCLSLALTDNKTEFWLSSALAGAGVTQSAPSRAVPCGGWRVRGGGRGLYLLNTRQSPAAHTTSNRYFAFLLQSRSNSATVNWLPIPPPGHRVRTLAERKS